jgi:hypothetical protein
MSLEFNFYVQSQRDMEYALASISNATACKDGAFGVQADQLGSRLANDISIEVGFPVTGVLSMWFTVDPLKLPTESSPVHLRPHAC